MANPNIGKLPCPFGTGRPAYIRRAKRGKYPLYLYTEISGPLFMKTPAGQEWILDRGTFYGPQEEEAPAAPQEPAAAPVEAQPEKPQRRRKFTII